jgi:hypothetical protein
MCDIKKQSYTEQPHLKGGSDLAAGTEAAGRGEEEARLLQIKTAAAASLPKILARNVMRILQKGQDGELLSGEELQQLRGFAENGKEGAEEWVSSQAGLAVRFGCHAHSFPRWRKSYPDAPRARQNGEHSVLAWREFFGRHPEIRLEPALGSEAAADRGELEARLLRIKIASAQFAFEVEKGQYTANVVLSQRLALLASEQLALLRQKLENGFPGLVAGLEPGQRAELRAMGRELVDELCVRMQRLVDSWK